MAEGGVEMQWEDLPDNPADAFFLGLECVFDEWHILNLAIRNGWAGDTKRALQKKEDVFYEILELFERSKLALKSYFNCAVSTSPFLEGTKVNEFDLQELLKAILLEDFRIDCQDGSAEFYAKLMITLYRDCFIKNDFNGMIKLLERKEARNDPVNQVVDSMETVVLQDQTQGSDQEEDHESEHEESQEDNEQQLNKSSSKSNSKPQVDEDGWATIPVKKKH